MSAENTGVSTLGAVLGATFAALNPWAVMGAAFGCCFFLSVSSLLSGWKRFQLLLFSFGIGYAAGEFWYGAGPPYDRNAMFVAAIGAALASVVFAAFYRVIENGGDLPPWLANLISRIPFFKGGGQ